MTHFILVPSLRLEAASGPTLYPGENGYSFVWGEVESDNPELNDVLDRTASSDSSITLRCGLLEITGRLKPQPRPGTGRGQSYKISLESVRYGVPDNAA
jgi:hypothetical protein